MLVKGGTDDVMYSQIKGYLFLVCAQFWHWVKELTNSDLDTIAAFCRRQFQMYILEERPEIVRRVQNFGWRLSLRGAIEIGNNWSGNGFAANKQQAIAWTNGDPVRRRIYPRSDSRFAPSQWETVLLCNDVSHWLGASLDSDPYPSPGLMG